MKDYPGRPPWYVMMRRTLRDVVRYLDDPFRFETPNRIARNIRAIDRALAIWNRQTTKSERQNLCNTLGFARQELIGFQQQLVNRLEDDELRREHRFDPEVEKARARREREYEHDLKRTDSLRRYSQQFLRRHHMKK